MVLRQGRLSEVASAEIAKQLLEMVLYINRHWVIHRDLKLENLIIDGNNQLKLFDFGMALKSKTFTVTGFSGSPGYIAPESFYTTQ
jgi:serine/threonine protein kinase